MKEAANTAPAAVAQVRFHHKKNQKKEIMKNALMFLAILGVVLLFHSCEKEEPRPQDETIVDLTGEWLGKGYQCPAGVKHDEIIEIKHNLETGEIVATKITGDNCVTAGNTTFTGIFSGKLNSSYPETRFNVTFVTGSPSFPNSSSTPSTLEVVNSNLFRDIAFEGAVFTRECDPYGFDEKVVGVPLIAQPNKVTCWAAATTMMWSWKKGVFYSINDALYEISLFWWTHFQLSSDETGGGLPLADADEFFTQDVGLTGIAMSYSIDGLKNLLATKGPLLVLPDEDLSVNTSHHARVLIGMHGDGSADCTYVISHDPWDGGQVRFESFSNFNKRYQQSNNNVKLYYFN